MGADDIAAIERATVAAVSPTAQEELAGWLLPFDAGVVNRAKSAVPLSHDPPALDLIAAIESRYLERGMRPLLRLPAVAAFDACRDALARRGWAETGKPVHVQVAPAAGVRAFTREPPADTDSRPDPGWASVFLGEGFDPVAGASRVAILSRAPDALFASVRENDDTVAAGMGAYSHGWASVHGMRTAQRCRGRGLAGRVLAALAHGALARGMERMFLQVEAGNDAAISLYRRAGFATAWNYSYWTPR
ncbi:GNAT family N-acetyltransferase [Caenimonas aquaedulcis]|uniref:GNAT family N-acetyltransferase n=1 Tax=Caenimonas aquaedulcis TaxID=2793270 RepID=A0A931H528_9BURK|nr:GNAT family N-acetyltransferase [Caenimonas aquaedulcis]MBG9388613.1 GNAT family N-acetyltransferase [Caenimonas aquaedulcis]